MLIGQYVFAVTGLQQAQGEVQAALRMRFRKSNGTGASGGAFMALFDRRKPSGSEAGTSASAPAQALVQAHVHVQVKVFSKK